VVCVVDACHDQPQPNCTHRTEMRMCRFATLLEATVDINGTLAPIPCGHHLWNKVATCRKWFHLLLNQLAECSPQVQGALDAMLIHCMGPCFESHCWHNPLLYPMKMLPTQTCNPSKQRTRLFLLYETFEEETIQEFAGFPST
jgi:hypothetical protein